MSIKKKTMLLSTLSIIGIASYFGFNSNTETVNAKNTQLTYDMVKNEDWGKKGDARPKWETTNNSKLMYEIYTGSNLTKFEGKTKNSTKNLRLTLKGFSAIGGFATHYKDNQTSFLVFEDTNSNLTGSPKRFKIARLDRQGAKNKWTGTPNQGWVSSTFSIFINGYNNRSKCVVSTSYSGSINDGNVNSKKTRLRDRLDKLNLAPQTCNRTYNGTGFKTSFYMKDMLLKQQKYEYKLWLVTQVRANNKRDNSNYQKTTYKDVILPKTLKSSYTNGLVNGQITFASDITSVDYGVVSEKVLRLRNSKNTNKVPSLNCMYEWSCSGNKEPRYYNYYGNGRGYDYWYKAKSLSNKGSVLPKLKGFGYSASYYGMVNDFNKSETIYTQTTYLEKKGKQATLTFIPKDIKKETKVVTRLFVENKKTPFKEFKMVRSPYKDKVILKSERIKPVMPVDGYSKPLKLIGNSTIKTFSTKTWENYVKKSDKDGIYYFDFYYEAPDEELLESGKFSMVGQAKMGLFKSSETAGTTIKRYSSLAMLPSGESKNDTILGARRLFSDVSYSGNYGGYKVDKKVKDINLNPSSTSHLTNTEISTNPKDYWNDRKKVQAGHLSSYGNPMMRFNAEVYTVNPNNFKIKIKTKELDYVSKSCSTDSKGVKHCTSRDVLKTVYVLKDVKASDVLNVVKDYSSGDKLFGLGYGNESDRDGGYYLRYKERKHLPYNEKPSTIKGLVKGLSVTHTDYNGTKKFNSDDGQLYNKTLSIERHSDGASFGFDASRFGIVHELSNTKDVLNAIVSKTLDGTTKEVDIRREYINLPSRQDKSLLTQGKLPILDNDIHYSNTNTPFTAGDFKEKMYGSNNTMKSYANADEKDSMTYIVPDVDKNLRERIKTSKNANGLTQYEIGLAYGTQKLHSKGSIMGQDGEKVERETITVPLETKNDYIISKNTGFLGEVKPKEDIRNSVSVQYKLATGKDYNDEPILPTVAKDNKMYHMPIEAENIIRKTSYEDAYENGEDDEVDEGNMDGEGNVVEGDGDVEMEDNTSYNSKPYPIDSEATVKHYADKFKRQIMIPETTYTNYGTFGKIGLSDLTFTYKQNFEFERFLAGSVQDNTWVAEQGELPEPIKSSTGTITDQIKGNSVYTTIDIPYATGKRISKEMKQDKLFGFRSSDGIGNYNKLKGFGINLKE